MTRRTLWLELLSGIVYHWFNPLHYTWSWLCMNLFFKWIDKIIQHMQSNKNWWKTYMHNKTISKKTTDLWAFSAIAQTWTEHKFQIFFFFLNISDLLKIIPQHFVLYKAVQDNSNYKNCLDSKTQTKIWVQTKIRKKIMR